METEIRIQAKLSEGTWIQFEDSDPAPIGKDVLFRRFRNDISRGVWKKEIKGWTVNPAHIVYMKVVE